jgi:hypothetical protein
MTQQPDRFDPTEYLILSDRQITASHIYNVEPLPPARTFVHVLWDHLGRFAPGLITTAATALAWAWHEQLPDGSLEPLWIGGLLTAVAGAAGIISAAKQHGDAETTRFAFGAAGVTTLLGIAAWTPDWALRVLLWLIGTAAVYAVCAPLWRKDRREERAQQHELKLAEASHRNDQAVALIEGQTRVAEKYWDYRTEAAHVEMVGRTVEALAQASEARANRALRPGQELDVDALLKAVGHEPKQAIDAAQGDQFGIETLLSATSEAPREPSAAERHGEWR